MRKKKKLPYWSTFALILGSFLLALALLWPWLGNAERTWTEEKAAQLQQAASTLHKLDGHGSELGNRPTGAKSSEPTDKDRQYDSALKEFQHLKLDLQEAKTGNWRTMKWLLGCGISLLGVGVLGRKMRRPQRNVATKSSS
jgi:hypothetical protein